MAVRVTEEDGTDGVTGPGTSGFRERHEGDQAGKNPDVGCGGDDGTFAEAVGDPANYEEVDGEHELRRDGEKICLKSAKAHSAKDVGEVGLVRLGWDISE